VAIRWEKNSVYSGRWEEEEDGKRRRTGRGGGQQSPEKDDKKKRAEAKAAAAGLETKAPKAEGIRKNTVPPWAAIAPPHRPFIDKDRPIISNTAAVPCSSPPNPPPGAIPIMRPYTNSIIRIPRPTTATTMTPIRFRGMIRRVIPVVVPMMAGEESAAAAEEEEEKREKEEGAEEEETHPMPPVANS